MTGPSCVSGCWFITCLTLLLNSSRALLKGLLWQGHSVVVELNHLPLFSILSQTNSSDHKVCQLLFTLHSDSYSTIHLLSILSSWPVLDTHDADEVEGPGHHHDAARLLLPGHPPEVRHGGLCGTLGHDVRLGLNKAI